MLEYAEVVSVTVLLFFLLIGFVFWLTSLHDKPDFQRQTNDRLRQGSGEVSPEFAADSART